MHHDLPLLINITVALCFAFVGGLIARRLKLPTLIGYMVAGVLIGPSTPGYVGDLHTIEQLAELGVIFLMFGVGLHFSLQDLWAVRRIAVPGALAQMVLATLLGLLLATYWGWSLGAGIVLGLGVSIASTVVLLRNLMDRGLINTVHGQIAVGWLVLEDLATVLILVLLPAFFSKSAQPIWLQAGIALLKAFLFAALMLIGGTRLVPWLVQKIVRLQSRELFIVSIVVITLGTALGAAVIFDVSLALGAFLAGVVVNESKFNHQVEAEIAPFREIFGVLFFASIGMLVNPLSLVTQFGAILSLTFLIVVGKALLVLLLGMILPSSARTTLIIAVALSQIGEFSFLLGQEGVRLHILTKEQYTLLLMGAIISILLNTLMFRALPQLEQALQAIKPFWAVLNRRVATPPEVVEPLQQHVVVVGYGRVGKYQVEVLTSLHIPCLVVELDASYFQVLEEKGIPSLYGDAANSSILEHAHIEYAKAVVVTLPNDISASSVVAAVRSVSQRIPIMARASSLQGIEHMFELNANDIIYPELEGSLELLSRTLISLGYPEGAVQRYAQSVRQNSYSLADLSKEEVNALTCVQLQAPKDPHSIG
ncbi:cation:proton antiporter [Tengunoibacter tsumagoiensis]|uniref:Sodium/hydrogen exchanger n=1 Tax=Tengunoibacter tsumagoiensis TaxID=2014871 RepID=A0A402A4B9_9CHLR|nr:cation:proton antiporter [Tengunoibacter tsumagoiensis]GCE13845.1 sodium/hydrogen exchanger [Tengunoibacter tsumagoiensis]